VQTGRPESPEAEGQEPSSLTRVQDLARRASSPEETPKAPPSPLTNRLTTVLAIVISLCLSAIVIAGTGALVELLIREW
jgi:hypothetical protein